MIARKILLRNLSGSGAFKSGNPKAQEYIEKIEGRAFPSSEIFSLFLLIGLINDYIRFNLAISFINFVLFNFGSAAFAVDDDDGSKSLTPFEVLKGLHLT